MEGTRKWKKASFSTILWAVFAVFLSVLPCDALPTGPLIGIQTVGSDEILYLGTIYDPNVGVTNGWVDLYGTLNMYPGAYVDNGIYAYAGSTVNIYGADFPLGLLNVLSINVAVTIHGMDFELSEADDAVLDNTEAPTSILVDESQGGGSGTLSWTYEGVPYSISFSSLADIQLIGSPEQLIEQLIVDVEVLNLKEGIDNSLDVKLQNALDALEAANAGQRQDAVNKMSAFISAVEAQSGKAIEELDANYLIDKANVIISLL